MAAPPKDKTKKTSKSAEENTYAKMTWPGLVGYVLDRHLVNCILLTVLSSLPASFVFLYYTAQSGELQREILLKTVDALSKLSPVTWLGWLLVPMLIMSILFLRHKYKKEIHRIANEKTLLHEQLNIFRESSGHVESNS